MRDYSQVRRALSTRPRTFTRSGSGAARARATVFEIGDTRYRLRFDRSIHGGNAIENPDYRSHDWQRETERELATKRRDRTF